MIFKFMRNFILLNGLKMKIKKKRLLYNIYYNIYIYIFYLFIYIINYYYYMNCPSFLMSLFHVLSIFFIVIYFYFYFFILYKI